MAYSKFLSKHKRDLYLQNSKLIKYWRRNPIIACRDILGIELLDYQKWQLAMSWNRPYVVWCCGRNSGKSFVGAIIMMLKFLLFENQQIYIISSVGSQSQETFLKIESIAKQRIESIKSLKDIFFYEVVKSSNGDGFVHDKTSFRMSSWNGSNIFTLNGNPDNNRSKRANIVFFDEAGFSSEEIISVSEAFATQESDFATDTDSNFDIRGEFKKCPTQLIFASSASDTTSTFWRKYKEYAIKMIAGDDRYFCCDISVDIPLAPLKDGEKYAPLLKKAQVDDAMRTNREKALREYYNKFQQDGGESQIIKRARITNNETFLLPKLSNTTGEEKFAIAIDPARSFDNSCCTIMEIKYDENVGYYGELCNGVTFADLGKKKKTPMRTPEQIKYAKQLILDYNGNGVPDYQNIEALLIDAGAGGGGRSAWADALLEDWSDAKGLKHKGFIDYEDDDYANERSEFPNASKILKLISPQKFKKQMCEELIELMDLDLIKFPKEYSGKGYITLAVDNGNERDIKTRQLTLEEELALVYMDILKTETTSIHRFQNAEKTNVVYKLPKDKERRMHDDKFYTLLLLAHHLYEKRREDQLSKSRTRKVVDLSQFKSCVTPVSF
jgi:hypothetical protein